MEKISRDEEVSKLKKQLEESRSRLKEIEQELKDQKTQYQTLFNHTESEIHSWRVIRDEKGEIKNWVLDNINPPALKSWSKKSSEVLGKTANEIFGFDAKEQFIDLVEPMIKTGEAQKWETYFEPTDQHLRMISIPNGDRFISIGRDVSKEKQVEKDNLHNKDFLSMIGEIAKVGGWYVEGKFDKLMATKATREIHEIDQEELTFEKAINFYHPDYREMVENAVTNAIEKGIPYQFDAEFITAKGKKLWVQAIGIPKMVGNKCVGLSGTFQDITERKKAEKRLAESEEKFKTLFKNSAVAKVLTDEKGNYLDVNDSACRLFGYSQEELLLMNVQDIVDAEAVQTKAEFEAFKKKGIEFGEIDLRCKDGSIRSVEYYAKKIGGDQHLSTLIDITERKKNQREKEAAEIKLRDITNSVPGAIYQFKFNADGTYSLPYISHRANELLGFSHQQMQDVHFLFSRIHPDDYEQTIKSIMKAKKDRSLWSTEFRALNHLDQEVWIKGHSYGTEDDDGSILHNGVFLDISAKKATEEELAQMNRNLEALVEERTAKAVQASKELELYRLAANHAQSGVWRYDIINNSLKWDDIMYKLHGIKQSDFSGAYDAWESSLHPEDKARTEAELNRAIEQKSVFDSLFRVVHPDNGKVSYIRGKGKVELDEKGKAVAVYGTNWDVSKEMQLAEDRKMALTKLKETQSQLIQSEKMASLGIMTAGVAHEINNPLNYIHGGYLAIHKKLKDQGSIKQSELEDYLEWIKKGAERATEIVKSLNIYSRRDIESDENCAVHEIIDDCLSMLKNKYQDRIAIQKDLTTKNAIIKANSGKLHQAILNILGNAIDAITEEGIIRIQTKRIGKKVQLKIEDNGCGIDPQHLEKVTDPFFTTKAPGKGTGLGLSIARSIIEEQNGSIQLSSTLNEGTTFILEFNAAE